MRVAAIVAAAGSGERLGAALPKALVMLAGRSLLAHALERLDESPVEWVIVAIPPGDERVAEEARRSTKLVAVVDGGASRQASIRAGLEALPAEADAVVCHDAARPLASPDLYAAVLAPLEAADGAVPILSPADTIKRLDGTTVVETLDRDELGLAQTPQAFQRSALETAHRLALADEVEATDDAALVERAGFKVVAVPGERANLKITHPGDLRAADDLARG